MRSSEKNHNDFQKRSLSAAQRLVAWLESSPKVPFIAIAMSVILTVVHGVSGNTGASSVGLVATAWALFWRWERKVRQETSQR